MGLCYTVALCFTGTILLYMYHHTSKYAYGVPQKYWSIKLGSTKKKHIISLKRVSRAFSIFFHICNVRYLGNSEIEQHINSRTVFKAYTIPKTK